MANSEHLEILKQGVEAWNKWRASNPATIPQLTGAEFRPTEYPTMEGIDLRGADLFQAKFQDSRLRQADLRHADLRQAQLDGCKLWGASMEAARLDRATVGNAEFNGADLTGASLSEVDLSAADLSRATFREAILQGANLQVQRGILRPEKFAGADLTNAKLPETLSDLFKDLKAVADISESARKLFVVMLAACLYSWLTIATTTDVNLITNRASSPLPIIQTSIPIVGFYVVAPLLLLCVYFYFHFYLQKLWEELGSLPAIFPDGRRLHERSDPWLLNDLVRAHLPLLKANRPFMSYFQQAISILLAWWILPVTLFLFWGRYLPRHDYRWTTLHVALLAISITGAARLYKLAADTLRGAERRPFAGMRTLKQPRAYAAASMFFVTAVVFMLVSVGAIGGVPPDRDPWWGGTKSGVWGLVPRAMALVSYSPFANLGGADISIKPLNWTGKNESELDFVKGAQFREHTNLRYANMRAVFLAKAEIANADLRGADLDFTDLSRANLNGAYLNGAHLLEAHLTGALLNNADLSGANLRGARLHEAQVIQTHLNNAALSNALLTGANLKYSDLSRADLNNAYLEGTRLLGARLNNAELIGAELSGADLSGAVLSGADLFGADLTGSSLTGADLTEADLSGAQLRASRLRAAHLVKANLLHANVKFADFRSLPRGQTTGLTVDGLRTAVEWDKAYYDDDILEVLFPNDWHDHNKKVAEEQKREEQQKGQAGAAGRGSPPGEEPPPTPGKPVNPNERKK